MVPDFESRFYLKDFFFFLPTRLLCSRGSILLEDNKFFFSFSFFLTKISSHKTEQKYFFLRTRNLVRVFSFLRLVKKKKKEN